MSSIEIEQPTVSVIPPSTPSIDARLNLSLDDLIKERKKEVKKEIQQKKRASVKQETTKPTKQEVHSKKQKKNANAQSDKRKALMNKNRGLAAPVPQTKEDNKKATTTPAAGKSIQEQRRQKKKLALKNAEATKQTNNKRVVITKQQQQPKKQQQQQKNKQQPQQVKKQQTVKQPTQPTPKKRAVVQSKKGAKVQITITRTKSELQRAKTNKVNQLKKKSMKNAATKALLPGKSQPKLTKKAMAQKLIKTVKTQHKQQGGVKNGKFTVRKPLIVRKVKVKK